MELEHVLIILLIVIVVYALSPDIERDTIKFVTGKHVGSGNEPIPNCIGTFSDTGCSRQVYDFPGSYPVRYDVKFAWANEDLAEKNIYVQCPLRSLKDGEKLINHTHLCQGV